MINLKGNMLFSQPHFDPVIKVKLELCHLLKKNNSTSHGHFRLTESRELCVPSIN